MHERHDCSRRWSWRSTQSKGEMCLGPWTKFRELVPVLTSRGASIKVKGRVYRACVQRVLCRENWPMKAEDMQRLERTERMMVRLMCGASLKSRLSSKDWNKRLIVEAVTDVVRQGRLRWFGHLERKDITMTGYQPVETLRWWVQNVTVGGKHGGSVWKGTWNHLVWRQNGRKTGRNGEDS